MADGKVLRDLLLLDAAGGGELTGSVAEIEEGAVPGGGQHG